MHRLIKFFVAAIFIISIMAVTLIIPAFGAIHEDKLLEELITNLEQRIPVLMDSYRIAGVAIALVEDGEIAWVNAYGYADLAVGREMTG